MVIQILSIESLLSQVAYNSGNHVVEGLGPIHALLDADADGVVAAELLARLPALPEKVRGGIAFALARSFQRRGNLPQIREMYRSGDTAVQAAVLNGLWGPPAEDAVPGDDIVALAVEGMGHAAPEVRSEAANVIKNQVAYGTCVAPALSPLRELLADPCPLVRQAATYAVGVIAKKNKTDLAPQLDRVVRNLSHQDRHVREASAWALWQLSRRCDISAAVMDLARLLANADRSTGPSKNAVDALLHHARKSSPGRAAVVQALSTFPLDIAHRGNRRLHEQLAALEQSSVSASAPVP